MKTRIAYKLFSQKKDGSIGPLFINVKQRLEVGEWVDAHCYPTKGFAVRKGWHCAGTKHAPHLSEKGRVWVKVEIADYTELPRPECQGGLWYLANKMKVLEIYNA